MSACLTVHLSCLMALIVLCPAPATAQTIDNPFIKAKVGQWAEYTAQIGGQSMTMRQTVTAKDSKNATVKVEVKVGPNAMGATEQKIPLDKPLDIGQLQRATGGAQGRGGNAEVKELERGKEEIEAGGKKYACTRIKFQAKTEVSGQKIESSFTIWVSPDAPLSGMVRLEVASPMMPQGIVFNLSATGSK